MRSIAMNVGRILRLAGASFVLLLASCSVISPGGVIYHDTIGVSGTAQNVNFGAAGRNLRTIVIGNPTALPQEEFAAIVRDHMQGANFGRPVKLVPAGLATPPEGYRLVLLFGSLPGVGDRTLCQAPLPAGGGPEAVVDGDLSVKAAFCTDERPVRSLTGEAFNFNDPRDPRFKRFLRDVGLAVFSPQNPEDRPDRDPPPIDPSS